MEPIQYSLLPLEETDSTNNVQWNYCCNIYDGTIVSVTLCHCIVYQRTGHWNHAYGHYFLDPSGEPDRAYIMETDYTMDEIQNNWYHGDIDWST